MSRHLSRLQALVLGTLVLGALGLGVFGLFAIGNRNGLDGSAFTVQAGFEDIGGVEVGTRIRIQGIDAGEVEAIVPPAAPGDLVQLRLLIAGKLRHLVTADARVQITSETLLTGKIVRILPGNPQAGPVEEGARLAAVPAVELGDGIALATGKLNHVLGEIDATLSEFRAGQGAAGTITKELAQATTKINAVLAKVDNEAYAEALSSLQDVRRMVVSVKQNADAIKSLPVVRSYVVDAHKELVRPDCIRYCKWFAEDKLFEPGRAVLTAGGKKALDEASSWLNEAKKSNQEMVVAVYAGSGQNAEFAQTLTQKQSEAVLEYLKSNHRVHRTGFWFWSNRTARAIGVGTNPPPVPGNEKLPPARIELLVFVPPGLK